MREYGVWEALSCFIDEVIDKATESADFILLDMAQHVKRCMDEVK